MPNHAVDTVKLVGMLAQVQREYQDARAKHVRMRSRHEGWAIIKEELDELWDEVRKKHPTVNEMRKEAIQVAAMAVAYALEVCDQ